MTCGKVAAVGGIALVAAVMLATLVPENRLLGTAGVALGTSCGGGGGGGGGSHATSAGAGVFWFIQVRSKHA